MRPVPLIRCWRTCAFAGLLSGAFLIGFISPAAADSSAFQVVTNVEQVRELATETPNASYVIHLEGDVWWAKPAEGKLVLKDDSGAEELEMDLAGQSVTAGQRIRVEGNGTITRTDGSFRIGAKGAVVDNDGVHGMVEKTGAVFLKAGRNPLRVEWFNGVEKYDLQVEYQGPGLPRQKIAANALYRMQVDGQNGSTNWLNGLDFRYCAAPDEFLPDFDASPAIKTGTVTNFDLSVIEQPDHVALCFTGFLEIPTDGLYTFYTTSDDGSRLFVGRPTLAVQTIGTAEFPTPKPITIGEVAHGPEGGQWAEVEGKVTFFSKQPDGAKLELAAGTGRISVEIADNAGLSPGQYLDKRIRAVGVCKNAYTSDGQPMLGVLLVQDGRGIQLIETPAQVVAGSETNIAQLPLLVTGGEVHHLKREEAQRGYPVKIRGVITSVLPEHQAFTMQDSTRGLYVIDFSASRSDAPKIGEFLEIEGKTDPSLFAPVVYAQKVTSLGAGNLPEPIRPTWDQLMNGSLDAQYVEIQGIITAVQTNQVSLLTRDGTIKMELRVKGLKPEDLVRYEDALVRVRGCLLAYWDYVTHTVKVGEVKVYGADITVDEPAPADLFSTPRKSVAELPLFDPQASLFQRVKVTGEIIRARDSEFFLMDGNNGLRFVTKHPVDLQGGDLVEAVGFPELSSASPVLRDAVVKKTGHATLPAPRELNQDQLISADNDSTRVRIKAVLISQRLTPTEQSLEMRAGLRVFLAWLPGKDPYIQAIPPGSLLELTGAYASQGGNPAAGKDIASFELLLNSPLDVKVLARPPWWTLQKLFVIMGALACVLAVTVLWITQLRRKVDQRTIELENQIRERQRVEQQRAMEQERSRIAQDLHDELGSGLTEITMLGARARTAMAAQRETRNSHLDQMGSKAREMVVALDEIVWAMNPTHDSLASIVSYFSLYAERFLGLANIAWRLEGPFQLADQAVDSRHRHQLFLAFKEALTNVVHHSGATEVKFSIKAQDGQILLTIADNGRGLADKDRTEAMDGVTNMRVRLEKLGGRFELESHPDQGTTIRFYLPSN